MIQLLPAIDLRAGRCVRLHQGDYSAETVYAQDPVAQAQSFAGEGAHWLHVVDLDGARTGSGSNRQAIAEIVAVTDLQVQVGGGVRTEADAEELIEAGVSRVVVGTAAHDEPEMVKKLAARFPVALGLDARGREVSVRGWTEGTSRDVVDMAKEFEYQGIAAVIVTQILRDATMLGPDLELLGEVLDATGLDVIASGGVGSVDDLVALAGLRRGDRKLSGVIVGKALYEGRFTLAQGLKAVRSGS